MGVSAVRSRLRVVSIPLDRLSDRDRSVRHHPYAQTSALAPCCASRSGYTNSMKTAISLPDAVFRAAERQAKRTRKSRSQLYAEALAEYLSRHAPEEVTEAMNLVVDQLDEGRDPFVYAAAQSVLQRVEW